jgi:DNA-binding response OmpR family regulator
VIEDIACGRITLHAISVGAYCLASSSCAHESQSTPGAPAMVYRFGECTLDTQRHRLQRAGQPVRLRAKAFQVLCYLLEHRDRTVLKAEL